MIDQKTVPPARRQEMAWPAPASVSTGAVATTDQGGWTTQRLEVINEAAGVCARCGMTGADTVVRGWHEEQLVAAHTRCVVGLGPARR